MTVGGIAGAAEQQTAKRKLDRKATTRSSADVRSSTFAPSACCSKSSETRRHDGHGTSLSGRPSAPEYWLMHTWWKTWAHDMAVNVSWERDNRLHELAGIAVCGCAAHGGDTVTHPGCYCGGATRVSTHGSSFVMALRQIAHTLMAASAFIAPRQCKGNGGRGCNASAL